MSVGKRQGKSLEDLTQAITSASSNFRNIRQQTELLCQPLDTEDYGIQTMPDVSPPKWHLAHTSWFFETFLLKPFLKGYREYHPRFHYLFNSYYETAGTFHPRPERGLLSRPSVSEIYHYRNYIDEHMLMLLNVTEHPSCDEITFRTELGCRHEQQHQELLLTDIKHIFAINPLKPPYRVLESIPDTEHKPLQWLNFSGELVNIGHHGDGFCFDNELPRHKVYNRPYALASRLVSNGEYMEFIEEGGYKQVQHWLSDAWKIVKSQNWHAPLYWEKIDNEWWHMTLAGMQPVNRHAPVCHVSFYEADAYARWVGKRLPTEAEWESAAAALTIMGNFKDNDYLQPIPGQQQGQLTQMYGDVWEWTQSSYAPYPGFKPLQGSLGEYNGKFMCNQMVLRGGSCVTPLDHIRASYRNFFYPKDRWQFSGVRLANDSYE